MKTDARVRYTRMRIEQAFYELLAQKPVSRITVKELCELAEINRATFYKHYADPFDLLEKQEGALLAEMEDHLSQPGSRGTRELLDMVLGDASDGVRSRYALIASPNGDPSFSSRLSGLFYETFRPGITQQLKNRTEGEQTAAYLFIVGGCAHLLSRWIENGMSSSIENMVAAMNEMCDAFLRGYSAAK